VGPSEHFLAWRLRRGDRQAACELIRSHHAGVYAYLRHLCGNPSLAEDLTQETYARAWQRVQTLRKCASLRSWLLAIARNEFLQWVRARRPDAAALDDLPEERDPDPGAEVALLIAERDRRVRRAVGRLDLPLQEAVALHYFQDLTLREVSEILGVPAGTVKSRLNRALSGLRAMLEEEEADDERQGIGKAIAGRS